MDNAFINGFLKRAANYGVSPDEALAIYKSASEAWTRSEGKNPAGGLNAKGRASYNRAHGGNLKPPAPHPKTEEAKGRRASFCARMKGMRAKLTGEKAKRDPDSRINKSLRAWNC